MKLVVSRAGPGRFLVDSPDLPGSPPVGRGHTVNSALGNWLHNNQTRMGAQVSVDETVAQYEHRRRRRELRTR